MNRAFWTTTCNFCGKVAVDKFLPSCDCEGYTKAEEEYLKEIRKDAEPEMTPQEFDAKFPKTYCGERLVITKDGGHKIKLEARKYADGEGLCVWIPFPAPPENADEDDGNTGLCWDFGAKDAEALYDMLGEYLCK